MKSVFDKEFAVYGKVIEGYDFAPLLRLVRETSENRLIIRFMSRVTRRSRRCRSPSRSRKGCSAGCRCRLATAMGTTSN